MEKHRRKKLISCLLTLALTLSFAPGVSAAEQEWDVSRSKKATELDVDMESTVTLSLPSAEEQLSSDVVFVLDQSSCAKAVADMMPDLLTSLESEIEKTGAEINVGVVVFRGNAQVAYALNKYTADSRAAIIQSVMEASAGMTLKGSNMPSGLLAAQQMLNASSTDASRQYMIMVSDGTTYVYTKDGDPSSHYGRTSGYYAMDGSLYEWQAKYNAGHVYSDSDMYALPAGFTNGGTVAEWEAFLSDIGSKRANFTQYDQEYTRTGSNSANLTKPDPVCTDETVKDFIINCEESMYQAADVYKALVEKGVNCYSIRTSDSYGVFTSFSKYLGEIGEGAGTDFSEITNDIRYAVGAGSTVEDKMGSEFDLVEDSFRLTVDGTELTCKKDGGTYKFGDASREDRFVVVYDKENDGFVWTINENISNFAAVQLSYKVKLVNPAEEAGTYEAATNEYATLTPKDSAGTVGKKLDFEVPVVTYTVAKHTVSYDANGGTGSMDAASGTSGSTVTVAENGFTRSGYTFTGWNTQADGKGTSYKAGDTITVGDQDTVLYAQWSKKDTGKTGQDKNSSDSTGTAKKAATVKTGDSSNMILWMSLMVICCAAAVAVLGIRKKHSR